MGTVDIKDRKLISGSLCKMNSNLIFQKRVPDLSIEISDEYEKMPEVFKQQIFKQHVDLKVIIDQYYQHQVKGQYSYEF